jgi:phage terminase large subunit
VLICREVKGSLAESVLKTFEDDVLGDRLFGFGDASRTNRHSYEYANGSAIVIGGLDKPEKLYSTEWDFVYLAEAIEMTKDAYERFGRAMSGNHVPLLDKAGNVIYGSDGKPLNRTQIILDTNPADPGHWLNQAATEVPEDIKQLNPLKFEDYRKLQEWNVRRPVVRLDDEPDPAKPMPIHRMMSRHPDNPRFWDIRTWQWTPAGKAVVLRELAGMTGHRRARLFEGRWVAAEGAVFPEFQRHIHVCKAFEPPAEWPSILLYDPGYSITAVLWMCLSPDGGLFIYDEIYEGGKSMEKHCEEIKRRNELHGRNVLRYFGDPNEMFSSRAQGPSCAEQARKYDLRFVPWPADKGSAFDAGVEGLRHVLANSEKNPKEPFYLMVCDNCTGVIGNFESWSFAKNAKGEFIVGADKYEKGNDHGIDCARGGVQSKFLQNIFNRAQQAA